MTRWMLASAASLALVSCGQPQSQQGNAAQSTGESAGRVEVTQSWVRDSAGRTANAAVFMTITSPVGDRLVGASSPAAQKTDLMTMKAEDDAMGMAYVDGIELPPGRAISLDPTGFHVWLEKLRMPLKAGEKFPITLQFAKAPPQEVMVPVIDLAGAGPK